MFVLKDFLEIAEKSVVIFVFGPSWCQHLSVHCHFDGAVTQTLVSRKSVVFAIEVFVGHCVEFLRIDICCVS